MNELKNNNYFLNSGYDTAQNNMLKDLALLEYAISNDINVILRVYFWKPLAITIGCNQKISSLYQEALQKYSLDVVKRPTGGRAVLHQGDVSYSFITNCNFLKNSSNVIQSYTQISQALVLALEILGVNNAYIAESGLSYTKSSACMAISTGADLEYQGKKIAGSAQLRKSGYILQHGSILIDQDFELTASVFNISIDSFKCINVAAITGIKPSDVEIVNALKEGFEKQFCLTFKDFEE